MKRGEALHTTRNRAVWLLRVFTLTILFLASQSESQAYDKILEWTPSTDSGVTSYKVYYKADSSGDRIIASYDGTGLVLVEESGSTRFVNSGFEVSGTSCHLSGLDSSRVYFFVVTSVNTEGVEGQVASDEKSTDVIPPTKPAVLSSTQIPGTRAVTFEWSDSIDPAPGSGMAGYSCILDEFSDTTPVARTNFGLVTSGTLYAPADGYYWFHIRAVDKVGQDEANASDTEHYGPIYIDKGPPFVENAFVYFVDRALYVIYSEPNMQNAQLQTNYSFDKGLQLSGDGTDLYGDGKIFRFPLKQDTLDGNLIYTMTVVDNPTDNVADAAGNPIPTYQRTFTINDDDRDGMADEWERTWFGDIASKDGIEDSDRDNLTDSTEYLYVNSDPQWGTGKWPLSPTNVDSDSDDIQDDYEIQHGLNPTDPSDRDLDPDGNGLTNYQEYFNSLVAPVIDPISDDWAGDWDPYTGPTPSLSEGSLPVTWSLVYGPPDMEIDALTGRCIGQTQQWRGARTPLPFERKTLEGSMR
jgi:hypothetical protein